jgi:hypothetical protein
MDVAAGPVDPHRCKLRGLSRQLVACYIASMSIRLAAAALLVLSAFPSPGIADCTCRAKGVVAEQGEVLCLATPQGPRMARCDKVLNNSSWTFLQAPCPVLGDITPAERALRRLADAGPQPERR